MAQQDCENVDGVGHRFNNIVITGRAHLGNTYGNPPPLSGVLAVISPSTPEPPSFSACYIFRSAVIPANCVRHGKVTQATPSRGVKDCLIALFLTDPVIDRETLKTEKGKRAAGTCEWIRNNDAYKTWLAGDTERLWISGSPGRGKTMLSVFLTEELEVRTRQMQDTELLFFFCTHQDQKRNSAAALLRSLAYQLITKRPDLYPLISSHFGDEKKTQATTSSAEALWIVVRALLLAPEAGKIFCVLDGLDECDQASQRFVISKLSELFSPDNSPERWKGRLRLGIVSRSLSGLETFTQLKLDPDHDEYVDSDIRRFIASRVSALQVPGLDEDLRGRVEKVLLSRAQGTFLWVGFVIQELSKKLTCVEILESLESLPSGLPGMYSRMLGQVDVDWRTVASKILRWVTLAVEPWTLQGLAQALETRPSSSLDIDQTIRDYVTICGPVVKITGDHVNLVHQSAKDYLLRAEPDDDPILEAFRIKKEAAHAELTTACVGGIESGPMRDAMTVSEIDEFVLRRKAPLLNYAARYWPEHAKDSGGCLDWSVQLKRAFFRPNSTTWFNWSQALVLIDSGPFRTFPQHPITEPVLMLHLACRFGILGLVRQLLSKTGHAFRFRSPAAQKDTSGDTALCVAVRRDQRAVVQLLLDHGINIDGKSRRGMTPVDIAMLAGNTRMIQFLLERGAKCDMKSALSTFGTLGEHIPVVRFLIERGADVNAANNYGETLLMEAVSKTDVSGATVLLEHGAMVHKRDIAGFTALFIAVTEGQEAMTRLLLDHGADVNEKHGVSGSALQSAALGGGVATLRLLLERGAEVKSSAGWKALRAAIQGQHPAAARVLLEWGADPGVFSSNARSLAKAARTGNEELVRLFIEHGADVNVGHRRRTPLQEARCNGHTEVVRLLESAGACPNGADDYDDGNSDESDSDSSVEHSDYTRQPLWVRLRFTIRELTSPHYWGIHPILE